MNKPTPFTTAFRGHSVTRKQSVRQLGLPSGGSEGLCWPAHPSAWQKLWLGNFGLWPASY